jgi:hypothetical protein
VRSRIAASEEGFTLGETPLLKGGRTGCEIVGIEIAEQACRPATPLDPNDAIIGTGRTEYKQDTWDRFLY